MERRIIKIAGLDANTTAHEKFSKINEGDTVLFEGGARFDGTFLLEGKNNVSIGFYGLSPAMIHGGKGDGLIIRNCSNIAIWGLHIKGSGWRENEKGIGVFIDECQEVTVQNVEANGFRKAGIGICSSGNVTVEGCFAHDNGFCGISSFVGRSKSRNIAVRHCKAFDNAGDPDIKDNHSGSGIAIFHAVNATVEYCEAAGNGWAQRQKNINGPVGIWCACDVEQVMFRKNISHHNRTQPGGVDGDGFDIDGGVVDGLMEYNYSYCNEGCGYLFCEYGSGLRWQNNNMRYCISLNDGQRVKRQGSVQYYGPDGLKLDGSLSQHCLFVPAPGRSCVVNETGRDCEGLILADSIFVRGSGAVKSEENRYLALKDNKEIMSEALYKCLIDHTPRVTDPRQLDRLPVFQHLRDGTLQGILDEMSDSAVIDRLFMKQPVEFAPQGELQFTYLLNTMDYEGSLYSGKCELCYDSIKPGMALRLSGKGARIMFEYPAMDMKKGHRAVLKARLCSPGVEAFFFIADQERIMKAVPLTGTVSDYRETVLEFDGFSGVPILGVLILSGDESVMLESVEVYAGVEISDQSEAHETRHSQQLKDTITCGDVFLEEGKMVLNGRGSHLYRPLYCAGALIEVQAKIEVAEGGGRIYVHSGNKTEVLEFKGGINEYSLILKDTAAAARAGIVCLSEVLIIHNLDIKTH